VGLQPTCDRCGASFSTRHNSSCAKGRLVISRNNELRYELCDMVSRAFQPSVIRYEPKIHKCHPTQAGQPCTPMAENGDHGDVRIRGLCERGSASILDVRVTDTEAPNYQMKDPSKVLKAAECLKEKKYLQPCLNQRCHVTPFIVPVDGLIRKEAKTVLKVLAARTAAKAGKTYSSVMRYMRARLSIAIVRTTHVCLRGSRVPMT
jgi:hypothetical protein